MSRGATTLFSDILLDNPSPALAEKQRQGRNPAHIARRNEALVDRFFFYDNTYKYRYEYLLELLSTDFFISEVTVAKTLLQPENVLYLRRLRQEPPTVVFFRKKWPFLKWDAA